MCDTAGAINLCPPSPVCARHLSDSRRPCRGRCRRGLGVARALLRTVRDPATACVRQQSPSIAHHKQGASPVGAATAADGQYAVDVAEDDWRIVPRKLGDQRSGLSALDASYVLQAVAGTRALTPLQALAGDVTGDGTLSVLDATRILQRVVGALPQFPAAQLCSSDWLFVPAAGSATNQSVAQPGYTAGACTAGAIAFQPLAGDAAEQDFQAILIGDVSGNW